MSRREAKDALYGDLAEVAKALGNGRRAELIDVLAQGERHVEDLASEIDQSVANTSFHLRTLATAGLVATRREGTRVYYRLADDRVGEMWRAVRDVGLAHRDRISALTAAYLGDRSSLEEISRGELLARIERGDVVVLDVRARAEYAAGHLPTAVSIPIDELENRLGEMPSDVEIVAYCRGPLCVYADEAVRMLAGSGRRALRLEAGFPEWREAGLPVGTTSG